MFDFNSYTLPISDPVIKFLIILTIILFIPILSEKIRIPQLLGMIISGVLIGPFGFNLLERDSSIILSGTAGLLYIMFLAGLEIDMNDFRKHALKSTLLGLYGFVIPMVLGTLVGYYLLKFSLLTSVLLASMFASHTLITYPIVSKMGITKNIAVNLSVGSSLITNILALLVLAVVVGMATGEVDNSFWIKLSLLFIAFTLIILFVFPLIARWFFKRFSDNVSQYIFVLTLVFLGAVLSMFAGIEAIIGAFMAGLALNRLVPRTSPLMNRIDFVGNAIFIPFFLIGVGMLIDYRAFKDINTIIVAVVMSVVATLGKFLAAWITQKNFRFTKAQGMLIFGLTNSQAAATLAAVLIGYNIILGTNAEGEPIRLLNDAVLNGTIIMILVTCTIASFVTQNSARQIAISDQSGTENKMMKERILLPLSNPANIDELVALSTIVKSKTNLDQLYALNIINTEIGLAEAEKNAHKLLELAKVAASATDVHLKPLLRYDMNLVHGLVNIMRENNITDLILGLHVRGGLTDTFLGTLTEGILERSNVTTFVYHPFQPIATLRRHVLIVPEFAEEEPGFSFWLAKIWNIGMNSGSKIIFYASDQTLDIIRNIHTKHPIDAEFYSFDARSEMDEIVQLTRADDNLVFVMSRKNMPSYHRYMAQVSKTLNQHYQNSNFMLIYPVQSFLMHDERIDLTESSLLETIENIDVIGKTIAGIFRKK
ncbi:MAG: cation:proton antiporter [Prolixibacteraceae bacterium]|nr:cation:proton antiporter [Prolixibacteraceae bacterium]